MQQVALLLCLCYIAWLFFKDVRRRDGLSWSLWSVVVWVMVLGSRPASTWFSYGGGGDYDSGNPLERMISFILMGIGLYALSKRKVQLGDVLRNNRWLVIFFGYWALSIVWSDAPFVSLKRWVKDVGNIIMVLVMLTEEDPIEAVKAVFVRCAFILVPFSLVFIKCFSDLGRAYTPMGEMMYTGVTTHKNMLGVLAMVCFLMLLWDFLDRWKQKDMPRDWFGVATDGSLIMMSVWLLYSAHSSTATACTAVGLLVFFALGLPMVQARATQLGTYALVIGVGLYALNEMVNLKKIIIVDILGKDMTLTTRTEVWPMLIELNPSVFLGCGFNSFWSGDRLDYVYAQLSIIQAHNGYLETYLNGGLIGVALLLILLFATANSIKGEFVMGGEFARIKMMFWVVTAIYNFTEAGFNKMGIIWFVTLLAMVQGPYGPILGSASAEDDADEYEFDGDRTETPGEPAIRPG